MESQRGSDDSSVVVRRSIVVRNAANPEPLFCPDGDLPLKAQELVKEWLDLYSDVLQKMWDTQKVEKLPPL